MVQVEWSAFHHPEAPEVLRVVRLLRARAARVEPTGSRKVAPAVQKGPWNRPKMPEAMKTRKPLKSLTIFHWMVTLRTR